MKLAIKNKGQKLYDTPAAKVSWRSFLKDVFICSLGAYGGPEAHFGVMISQLVVKKKYVTEEEVLELLALTTVLPGPSSTQTIVAIGYKLGGPWLGLLTMLVWALPVLLIMTLLSFFVAGANTMETSKKGFQYIGPMAVGFIVVAAYHISKKVVKDKLTLGLLLFGAITTYLIRQSWVFPSVLIVGGMISVLHSKQKKLWNPVTLTPPWKYLIAFLIFAVGGIVLKYWNDHILTYLFESFYRYGYLVIGGGQVVVPMMFSELVEINQFISGEEFLTGYGLVQGLPGPMFSFSAFTGGMAASSMGVIMQILGAMTAGVAIFLPGILLIYFVYPIWEQLKVIKGIKLSIQGITAVSGGLIVSSAILLMQKSGFALDNVLVLIGTVVLLLTKKIPAPLIVLLVIGLGFLV